MTIPIPPELADAVGEDDLPARFQWLAALPGVVEQIASEWGLELGKPYLPGGQCAWVAPARDGGLDELVLKVGWRHREAEHEAAALRFWDGDGTVRCLGPGRCRTRPCRCSSAACRDSSWEWRCPSPSRTW